MAREIRREISIATVRKHGKVYLPYISHLIGDEWGLRAYDSEEKARTYVNSIWQGVAWISPGDFTMRVRKERM